MQRVVSQTRIGETLVRYRTRIESIACQKGSSNARRVLWDLLQDFVNVPDLLNCGLSSPDDVRFVHNGQCWIVEAEAVGQG